MKTEEIILKLFVKPGFKDKICVYPKIIHSMVWAVFHSEDFMSKILIFHWKFDLFLLFQR